MAHVEQSDVTDRLAVHRPRTDAEWATWRAVRHRARTAVATYAHDAADETELLAALGLDEAGEAALISNLQP